MVVLAGRIARGTNGSGYDDPARKLRHLGPGIAARQGELMGGLKVQPELRVHAEPVTEPERGVAGDGALAIDNLRQAVGRNVDLPRQFGQFVGEDFAGVNGAGHGPTICNS